jgi:hypothetical protein
VHGNLAGFNRSYVVAHARHGRLERNITVSTPGGARQFLRLGILRQAARTAIVLQFLLATFFTEY